MTSDPSQNDLRNRVIQCSREDLLELISEILMSSQSDNLADTIIHLHNIGQIDIIATFSGLNQSQNGGTHFFRQRQFFEAILPKLHADVAIVMACVIHLIKEAGQDLTANTLLKPFVEYCTADASRPSAGISIIERSPDQYAVLLAPILIAGTQLDFDLYFEETLRLIDCDNEEIHRKSILALGRFQYPDDLKLLEKALTSLETVLVTEVDDTALAHLIDSVARLYSYNNTFELRVNQVLDKALEKGHDIALNAASIIFGFSYKEVSENVIGVLLKHLRNVNPTHNRNLDYVDYGIENLLNDDKTDEAIAYLEDFLYKNKGQISVSSFNSTCQKIIENKGGILFKILTKWLLSGQPERCNAIVDILSLTHGADVILSIDSSEIDVSNEDYLLFIARKAVGYLFHKPVSAASLIISIMRLSPESKVVPKLSSLLFDPLLITYPGKVRDYLDQQLESLDSEFLAEALRTAVQESEKYFSDLQSIGMIPELHPPQKNVEAYRRKFQKQMSDAMEKAERQSVFSSIMPKSILLYGNTMINYVDNSGGETRRIATPLQQYGNEFELPRLAIIAAVELDYMQRIFMAERLTENETNH